jgi:hypothetical protein
MDASSSGKDQLRDTGIGRRSVTKRVFEKCGLERIQLKWHRAGSSGGLIKYGNEPPDHITTSYVIQGTME